MSIYTSIYIYHVYNFMFNVIVCNITNRISDLKSHSRTENKSVRFHFVRLVAILLKL